ncbi:hypothetical protein MAR_037601 [Mya arenaria]|uniref:Uncharacterized protein n=1 Tax=Mya arenaria TaxID=6604 RepID=A0ABY7FP74_MYAAR|nr:hypothetical protein MAR_037601 [Mya arenaria]
MRYATAVIDSVILAGKETQFPGDEIKFKWKLMALYELMGTTLVIDPSYTQVLKRLMNAFERKMKKDNGCLY